MQNPDTSSPESVRADNGPDTTFRLDDVSFSVPGRTLLHSLSLTFPLGKVCGLIGHNGSGKSTLLKMLGRHQTPSSGVISVKDTPLPGWDSKSFARQVAYLPQQLPAAEGMTVRELVALGRYPWHGALGRFGSTDREKVENAIAVVGLKPFAHRLVDSLSGGERQRAWLAMTVAQDSRCLLLDEPTSALDVSIQAEILNLLMRLRRKLGLSYLMVSHDLAVVAHMCDRVAIMQHGRILEELSSDALRAGDVHEDYTKSFLAASAPALRRA